MKNLRILALLFFADTLFAKSEQQLANFLNRNHASVLEK